MRGLIAPLSIALFAVGCSESPSQVSIPTAPGAVAPLPTPTTANGSVVWIDIKSPRTLCNEITRQVGSAYPLWLAMHSDATSVTLSLSHEGAPGSDPMADPPGIFTGSRNGDEIQASYSGPMGGLACPGDRSMTPETGGTLSARVAGDRISGEYTEIYGAGADQITFVFRFEATIGM